MSAIEAQEVTTTCEQWTFFTDRFVGSYVVDTKALVLKRAIRNDSRKSFEGRKTWCGVHAVGQCN